MRRSRTLFIIGMVSLLSGCGATVSPEHTAQDTWLRPATVPAPATNQPTVARVELGKHLFFDPRLSGSGMISCATCHNPSLGWSDGQPTAIGFQSKQLKRATPTIINAAYLPLQMWDGRKNSLEDQALGPITSADEMNLSAEELETRLRSIPGYHALFESAYPGEGISRDTVAKALASFERTVVSTLAPFDRWRRGDAQALSKSAQRGFTTFNGKGKCALCHQGFNFSDNGFHNIGLLSANEADDEGRFAHRKVKVLKGAFKTPTLRDIELTAPYMHNGMYQTLEQVVDHYDRGGDSRDNLDANMTSLGLSAQEKLDLVAFMKSLTGPKLSVELPSLPPNGDASNRLAAK